MELKVGGEEPRKHNEGPVFSHFWFSNQEMEKMFVQDLWNKCLEEGVALPHPKIKVYDDNGTPVRTVVNKEFEVQDSYMLKKTREIARFVWVLDFVNSLTVCYNKFVPVVSTCSALISFILKS